MVIAMEDPQRMADLVGSGLDQVSHKSLFPGILNVRNKPDLGEVNPNIGCAHCPDFSIVEMQVA